MHAHYDYVVDRTGYGEWTIRFCGAPHGRYARLKSAMTDAVADARRASQRGWDVRVYLRRPNGRARRLWPMKG